MLDGGVEEADELRAKAERCLRLAEWINDVEARAALRNLAAVYQIKAKQIEEGGDEPPQQIIEPRQPMG